ncbi:MAG: T9SS type A sorting domain-containing protein [Bacteroidetes bacterium]|nr:T9SS type A sorting domain-containing protein [Bacteroidota bacterium]
MKKLIIVLLFSIPFVGFTQTWYPIGATWYFNNQSMELFPAHGFTKYTVLKDTIVDLKSSKLISRLSVRYNGDTLNQDNVIVREENSNVYYYINNAFQLMYDFTLNVGDTLVIDINGAGCDSVSPLIVDSIKNVNIDGVNLQVQYVKAVYYISPTFGGQNDTITYPIIEKIGYNNFCVSSEESFFFYPFCAPEAQFHLNWLRCYNDSNISYNGCYWEANFPDIACDSLIDGSTGISNISNGIDNISIFPNPANNKIEIILENYRNESIEISIFNTMNQEIFANSVFERKTTIDLSSFSRGMYFVKVKRGNDLFVRKLILE